MTKQTYDKASCFVHFPNYFLYYLFLYFRLDIKSVGKDHVEFLYKKNSIREISRIDLWHHNQSEKWVDSEWELIQNADDAEIVRFKPLIKTDHGFDIRVIAIGNDDAIKILTKEKITLIGLSLLILFIDSYLSHKNYVIGYIILQLLYFYVNFKQS